MCLWVNSYLHTQMNIFNTHIHVYIYEYCMFTYMYIYMYVNTFTLKIHTLTPTHVKEVHICTQVQRRRGRRQQSEKQS